MITYQDPSSETRTDTRVDNLDRAILTALQTNADLTNEALGKLVHASPATCQRRVKRLKDIGAIEKIVAIVNPASVGEPLTAIVEVTLASQTEEVFKAFEAKAKGLGFVQQCYRVSTGPDMVLVLAVPDMHAYHELAASLFTAANDVRNVRTFFSVLRTKFGTDIPV